MRLPACAVWVCARGAGGFLNSNYVICLWPLSLITLGHVGTCGAMVSLAAPFAAHPALERGGEGVPEVAASAPPWTLDMDDMLRAA